MFKYRLKKLRQEKKYTQDDLAKLINATKGTISNYENGYSTPSNEILRNLADILGTTTDYLLGRTDNPSPNEDEETFEDWINDPETEIFFKDYLSAPEERKKELRQFWEFLKQQEKNEK